MSQVTALLYTVGIKEDPANEKGTSYSKGDGTQGLRFGRDSKVRQRSGKALEWKERRAFWALIGGCCCKEAGGGLTRSKTSYWLGVHA